MIGDVEKFGAELCVELLANPHILQQREIEITISRPNNDVSSGGSKGELLIVHERRRVEPLLDGVGTGVGIADEVRAVFRQAASEPPLKGIMDVLEEGWPSSRIVGDTHSSIVDLPLVAVQGGTLVSIAAWYDNEWAFATRLAEVAAHLSVRGGAV